MRQDKKEAFQKLAQFKMEKSRFLAQEKAKSDGTPAQRAAFFAIRGVLESHKQQADDFIKTWTPIHISMPVALSLMKGPTSEG